MGLMSVTGLLRFKFFFLVFVCDEREGAKGKEEKWKKR